jgi:hypothetical protein
MQGGQGSVVVQSTTEMGAVVQIVARGQVPTSGAYLGFQGSNQFWVPLVLRQRASASGVANSQLVIQNADTSSFNVTVHFVPSPGITGEYTKTITSLGAGVSYYYDISTETNLAVGWTGSAVITGAGSGKIAVVSNVFTGPDILMTVNGFASGSEGPEWKIPTFFGRLSNGLSSVVTFMNVSGSNILTGTVDLSCVTTKASTPVTFTVSNPGIVANYASYSFNPVTDKVLFPNGNWEGACTLDAGSANVVTYVQLRLVGNPAGNVGADSYQAIRAGGTDTKMYVPLIGRRETSGFATVVTIQNMSDVLTATTNLYYIPATNGACAVSVCDMNHDSKVDASDTITVTNLLIGPGLSVQRNHRLPIGSGGDAENTVPYNWEGSLRVESNQPIDGYVQLTNWLYNDGDRTMAVRNFTKP